MSVPCPHCGAMIDEDATFCRHCGSSEADGWGDAWAEEEADWQDDFDYEAFVEENFSDSPISSSNKPLWRLTAGLLLCLILLYVLLALS